MISENEGIRHKYSTRFLAIKLLENDTDLETLIKTLPNGKEIIDVRDQESRRIRDVLNEDCDQAITDAKYGFISGALKETFVDNHLDKEHTTRVIDSIVTHRVWGFPIFFLFMYLMFEGTFVLGEYPMMGIEWLVETLGNFIHANMADGPLKDLLVDGIVGGVGGVIVFLPNILILYFCISLMEDSGYMARAAFIMDKIMHKMGLHGKSFIPLIMGFGCNVPAIMASRTIENRKSRLITMLVNPLMSCSARLPIYLLLVGAFFPNNGSLILLLIYSIGILLAVLLARLFSRFLVKGDDTPFVMELPQYHIPQAKTVLLHVWERLKGFIIKAGTILFLATVIMWILSSIGNTGSGIGFVEDSNDSIMAILGGILAPIFAPLGFGKWQPVAASISGFSAKESIVSTMGVLANVAGDDAEDTMIVGAAIKAWFPTAVAAFSFLLFNLLDSACLAAISTMAHEMQSRKWFWFAILFQNIFAYVVCLIVYQVGSFVTGGAFGVGTAVGFILLIFLLFMLFRPDPYKDQKVYSKRSVQAA